MYENTPSACYHSIALSIIYTSYIMGIYVCPLFNVCLLQSTLEKFPLQFPYILKAFANK